MASFYSVVQYVPDDVRGERINIGVVVFEGNATRVHFLNSWDRVRKFAPFDVVKSLRDFSRHVRGMNEVAIRSAADRWTYGVQFTKPAGSLLAADSLLINVAARFLIDPPPGGSPAYRVKSVIAKDARQQVKNVLVWQMGGIGRRFVREDYEITGSRGPQPFDIAVANGSPYFAAQAVSFQVPDEQRAIRNASSAAWSIQTVRETRPDLNLAVVMAPPADTTLGSYQDALGAFRDLKATVLREDEVAGWARSLVGLVPTPG